MKGIPSKITKTLMPGSLMTCADNSGAKIVEEEVSGSTAG